MRRRRGAVRRERRLPEANSRDLGWRKSCATMRKILNVGRLQVYRSEGVTVKPPGPGRTRTTRVTSSLSETNGRTEHSSRRAARSGGGLRTQEPVGEDRGEP